jgi:CRP-like cAMP-binding protein
MPEVICNEEGKEYNFKFVVTGTFIGDKGETISKERILQVYRLTDKNEAWRLLSKADFELEVM